MAEVDNKIEGPGKLLVSARKKLGLSKSDIAQQLNLSVTVIGQLESDHYTGDIPDAFLRGYLRTYARAVKQDEEQVVALYSQQIGSTIVRNHYVPSEDVPPLKVQVGSHVPWFKALSVVMVIIILGLGWMAYSESKTEQNPTDELTVQPLNSNEVTDVDSSDEQQAEYLAADVEDDTELDVQAFPDESEVVTSLPAREIIEPPVLEEAELEFTFLEDCWVQVTDSNDEVLAVGLKTAGRRFTVSGAPPINVVLGKPRAVSIQFNNQAVDLSIYPAAQTARFTLGE